MEPQYRSTGAPISLSLSAGTAGKIFGVIISVVGVVMALVFVAVTWGATALIDGFIASAPESPAPADPMLDSFGLATSVFRVLGIACGLPIAVVFAYIGLRALRGRIWMEGTTVMARGALRTKRVDIARAAVTGDAVTYSSTMGNHHTIYTVAAVAARDLGTGVTVKIPLRDQRLRRLPGSALIALADAIMWGRPHGPGYAEAERIAASLRQSAQDPFPV